MAATKKTTTKRKAAKTQTARTSSRSINSIEKKWKTEGELGATEAIILKYAKILDMTDSGRDMKPLASGMLEAIDRYKALKAAKGEDAENELKPVFKILKAANGE